MIQLKIPASISLPEIRSLAHLRTPTGFLSFGHSDRHPAMVVGPFGPFDRQQSYFVRNGGACCTYQSEPFSNFANWPAAGRWVCETRSKRLPLSLGYQGVEKPAGPLKIRGGYKCASLAINFHAFLDKVLRALRRPERLSRALPARSARAPRRFRRANRCSGARTPEIADRDPAHRA